MTANLLEQGTKELEGLIKLGVTRFSHDRGEPDTTPAFPYEVAFTMGNWEQFVLGIKPCSPASKPKRGWRSTIGDSI